MTDDLLECLKNPKNRSSAVWLDAEELGSKVLLAGKPFPWTHVTEFVDSYCRLHEWLKSDVLPVHVERCLLHWLQSNSGALYEMSGKKRVRYAIKRLLGLEGHRQLATEIVSALGKSVSTPLVIVLPENGELTRWAHRTANNEEIAEITDIDIDSVSVYLADYLRIFSGLPVKGVLIPLPDETAVNDALLELYSPVLNVARHYDWQCGIKVTAPAAFEPENQAVDFTVSDVRKHAVWGSILEEDFWREGKPPPGRPDFYWSRVPPDTAPETVLARLRDL